MAKAAEFCTAHFTALLYAELWCQNQVDGEIGDFDQSNCSVTKLDVIYDQIDDVTGMALQAILKKVSTLLECV